MGERQGGPGRGMERSQRDWTKGNVFRNLIGLSWPMVVSQTITALGPTIDLIWVGKLGSASIAGVGISSMIVMLMNAATMGLQMGTRAMVARFVGAGDEKQANHAAQQAFVVASVFSIIMAFIGISLAPTILRLLGLEADVVREGAAYLRIQLTGMITMAFQQMSQGVMQASGDTVTPMKIAIGARILHIIVCPFMVFGWWIFPELGVSGAALTSVVSQGIAGGLGLWMLYSGRTRLRLTLKGFYLDWNIIKRILKIGVPAMVNAAERTMGNLIVTWFVVPFGTTAVAAHSLLQRIDMFIHIPSMTLGQGAGVLAAQNLGAKQPERAEKTGWQAVFLATAMLVTISIIIAIWAEKIIWVFNSEPEMIRLGSTFMRIEIIAYITFGFAMVLMQLLNGVGDTVVTMVVTLVAMWCIQMPLAWVLSKYTGLGVYGVRWALVIAILIRGTIYTIYFKTGRWKRKQV